MELQGVDKSQVILWQQDDPELEDCLCQAQPEGGHNEEEDHFELKE